MHHPNSKHEPENSPWKRATFDALKTSRDQTLRTPCEENAAALAALFDGESRGEETQRAARHLEECARCRALLQGWQRTRELLLSTPPAVAPPLLLPRVLAAWRLVALRDSLNNEALPGAVPNAAAMPRDVAPPPELARAILRATSAAPARVLADAVPSRAATIQRTASRVFALAVPACLILAAFSLQSGTTEETLPSAFSPMRQRAGTAPLAAGSPAKPDRKSATISPATATPAKIAVASTRAVAPTVSQTASEKAAPAETEIAVSEAAPRRAIATEILPFRDALPRAEKIALQRVAAPRSEFLKLSAITGKFASLPVAKAVTASSAKSTERVPQPAKISMMFSRRAVFSAPRLTIGAPVAAARARLAAARFTTVATQADGENAPRATRPDAGLRDASAGLAPADFRSVRPVATTATRSSLGAPARLAYAASAPDNAGDSSDALDEMRAATNSYRAALDAETDGSDGNI